MVLIYFLSFLIPFIFNYRKHGFNISTLLILVYLISSFSALLLVNIYPSDYNPSNITIIAVLSHLILLFLYLYPIVNVGNRLILENIVISKKIICQLSYFLIIVGFSGILVSYYGIVDVLSADNFEAARFDALNREDTSLYQYGLIGYLGTIGSMSPLFALFCSFYRLFCLNKKDLLFYLLFFSSFSGAFLNFSGAGRDGFVRWGMFFILCLVLFRKEFCFKKVPKLLLFLLFIILILIVILFIAITLARFGEGESSWKSILEYAGQSFYYYSDTFEGVGNENLFGFASIFPIIPGGMTPLDIARVNTYNFRLDVFPTFVGTFVLSIGYLNTLIMGLLFFLFYLYFNRIKFSKLSHIVSYLIFYQVTYIGIFYFVFAMLARQLSFIIIYLVSFRYYSIVHRSNR